MALSLRCLRALLAVVDEGTFTDAAIALRTSQASVSRAVADLEQEIGVRMVHRTSRGVLPTVAGRRVVEHARRIMAEIAALESMRADAPGDLRVGFAWSVFGRLTTPVHRRWSATHPDGELTFVQSTTPTAGLLDGDCDVAVVRRALDDARFEQSLVGTESRVAAVSLDDPLAGRDHVLLGQLSDRPIAVDRLTGTTTTGLWPADRAPAVTRDVHGIEEWLTMVAAGAAIGITSEATAEQFPRSDVRYLPVRDAPPIAVWLVWWRHDPPPLAIEFLGLVCEFYGSRPPTPPTPPAPPAPPSSAAHERLH